MTAHAADASDADSIPGEGLCLAHRSDAARNEAAAAYPDAGGRCRRGC